MTNCNEMFVENEQTDKNTTENNKSTQNNVIIVPIPYYETTENEKKIEKLLQENARLLAENQAYQRLVGGFCEVLANDGNQEENTREATTMAAKTTKLPPPIVIPKSSNIHQKNKKTKSSNNFRVFAIKICTILVIVCAYVAVLAGLDMLIISLVGWTAFAYYRLSNGSIYYGLFYTFWTMALHCSSIIFKKGMIEQKWARIRTLLAITALLLLCSICIWAISALVYGHPLLTPPTTEFPPCAAKIDKIMINEDQCKPSHYPTKYLIVYYSVFGAITVSIPFDLKYYFAILMSYDPMFLVLL